MTTLAALETPRLRLRSPTLEDADGIAAYGGDHAPHCEIDNRAARRARRARASNVGR
jgi:hypothetical protein